MNHYISLEEAKHKHCSVCRDRYYCYRGDGWSCRELKEFDTIPASDVRPVVLCRDCKYFYNGRDQKCCINHAGVVLTDEDGFCHHGVKAETCGSYTEWEEGT